MQAKIVNHDEELFVSKKNPKGLWEASKFEDAVFTMVFEAEELEFAVTLMTLMYQLSGQDALKSVLQKLHTAIKERDGNSNDPFLMETPKREM